MNYRHVYMLIIEHAKKEVSLDLRPKAKYLKKNFPNQYFEFHHILPKSLFPLWKNRKSNIIPLTAREHFFCHQLLTKIYPNKSMFFALHQMVFCTENSSRIKCTSYEYSRIKEKFSELSKLPKSITENGRKKLSETAKAVNAKRWTDESNREQLSNKLKEWWRLHPKAKKPRQYKVKSYFETHGFEKYSEEYYKMMENATKKKAEATKRRWEKFREEGKKLEIKNPHVYTEEELKSRSDRKKEYWSSMSKEERSNKIKSLMKNRQPRMQSEEEKLARRKHMDEYNKYLENNDFIEYSVFVKKFRKLLNYANKE